MWTVLFEISSWFLVYVSALKSETLKAGLKKKFSFMSEVWTPGKKSEPELTSIGL